MRLFTVRAGRPALVRLALAACLLVASQAPCSAQPVYDLLICNGRILDGTGNPWYRADIGIRDGRIAAIGSLAASPARERLDARDRVVAPGFIDIHTHSDLTLLIDGDAQSHVRQGVTLVVLGELDSVGPLSGPVLEHYRAQARRMFGFSDVSWTSVAGYFDRLERQGVAINVATKVSVQQVRQAVVGFTDRPASADERRRMRELLEQSLREGAVGISSAFEGPYAKHHPEEIIDLARVAARYGAFYETHMGTEGYEIMDEVRAAIRVAREASIGVHISHLKIRGRELWGTLGPVFALIEAARADGADVTANQYPYTAMTHPVWALLPPWLAADPGRLVEALSDPAIRDKARQDELFLRYVAEHGGWSGIVASRFVNPRLKQYEGRSIEDIARARGDRDPATTLFDLIVEDRGAVLGIYHNMSESDVRAIMRRPWVSIASDGVGLSRTGALSDWLPHPRFFGTFPRVLGKYVREEAVLHLADAVRKMTSFPAQVLRLKDRGLLREGYWADIVIFDPGRIADTATFEKPTRYPRGIEHVIVNGVPVISAGEHTGKRPGRAIRKTADLH